MRRIFALTAAFLLLAAPARADVLSIGEAVIPPGIHVYFEASPRDVMFPTHLTPGPNDTDVHLQARVVWDNETFPLGALPGTFIPYVTVKAQVQRQKGGPVLEVTLPVTLDLKSNFHYSRNIKLPASLEDTYRVTFSLSAPPEGLILQHGDWTNKYGKGLLFAPQTFTYNDVSFSDVARTMRDTY